VTTFSLDKTGKAFVITTVTNFLIALAKVINTLDTFLDTSQLARVLLLLPNMCFAIYRQVFLTF